LRDLTRANRLIKKLRRLVVSGNNIETGSDIVYQTWNAEVEVTVDGEVQQVSSLLHLDTPGCPKIDLDDLTTVGDLGYNTAGSRQQRQHQRHHSYSASILSSASSTRSRRSQQCPNPNHHLVQQHAQPDMHSKLRSTLYRLLLRPLAYRHAPRFPLASPY